jgi:hypothetical protein
MPSPPHLELLLCPDPQAPPVSIHVRESTAHFLGWSDFLPVAGSAHEPPAGLPEHGGQPTAARPGGALGHVGRVTLADYDTPAGRRVCFQFRLAQPPDPQILRALRSVTVPRIQRIQAGSVCWTNPEV